MEVLAGARGETHAADLRRLLARATSLGTRTEHYELAAGIFRLARSHDRTVRRMNDCLIAAIAIDHGASLLHADRDFAVIAEVSGLRIAR